MTPARALRDRVLSGSGEDRALTHDVARYFGWHRVEPRFSKTRKGGWIEPREFMGVRGDGSPVLSQHGTTIWPETPRYLTDLNAVIALVEMRLEDAAWTVAKCLGEANLPRGPGFPFFGDVASPSWVLDDGPDQRQADAYASSPARALLAALLSAEIEKETRDG